MDHSEGDARRRRRDWLLRLCSQSQQRQQVGPGGAGMQRVQGPAGWEPAPGWVGQGGPEALLQADLLEVPQP